MDLNKPKDELIEEMNNLSDSFDKNKDMIAQIAKVLLEREYHYKRKSDNGEKS